MDDELKLVAALQDRAGFVARGPAYLIKMCEQAAATITHLRAEIEALKSDVSDLVRAGSDEATENANLLDRTLELIARAETAEAQRDELRHELVTSGICFDKAVKDRDAALEALRAIEIEATREGGNWVHLRRNIAVQARKARTLEGGEG